MQRIFLPLAVVTDVMAATVLKVSDGFTRPIPTLSAIAAGVISIILFSKVASH